MEEYKNWLLKNTREQLEFVLLDLIRLSESKKVLCDCHLTVAQALAFSEPARVVFLIKDPSNLVDEYGNRPDQFAGYFLTNYLVSFIITGVMMKNEKRNHGKNKTGGFGRIL